MLGVQDAMTNRLRIDENMGKSFGSRKMSTAHKEIALKRLYGRTICYRCHARNAKRAKRCRKCGSKVRRPSMLSFFG